MATHSSSSKTDRSSSFSSTSSYSSSMSDKQAHHSTAAAQHTGGLHGAHQSPHFENYHAHDTTQSGSIQHASSVHVETHEYTTHHTEGTITTRGHSRSSSRSHGDHNEHVTVHTRYQEPSRSLSAETPMRRRVVRRVERQQPRLMAHDEHIEDGEGRILKEYQFEEQVAVEYRAIRQDVVEHLVAVPVTEEEVKKEHIPVRYVEVEKLMPYQTVIEVPETEVVEKYREVPTPSGRVQKKINYIPVKKVIPQERKIIVERPIEQIVEVPEITYIDVEEVIETVEVPEYQEVIKVVEKLVPTVIEIPREVIEETDQITEIPVLIPFGVEAHTEVEYTIPTIIEKRVSRGYPVYVPRFVEVPTSSIQLTGEQRNKCKKLLNQVKELENTVHLNGRVISVCEVEKMGVAARDHHACIQGHIDSSDIKASLMNVFGQENTKGSSFSSSMSDAPVKENDNAGYYGHANVGGNWDAIHYDASRKNRHSIGTSIAGTSIRTHTTHNTKPVSHHTTTTVRH